MQPKTSQKFKNVACFRLLFKIKQPKRLQSTKSVAWVLSASVCGTGGFSAHTATHSMSENAHETQSFLLIYSNPQNTATSKSPSLSVSHNTNHFPLP